MTNQAPSHDRYQDLPRLDAPLVDVSGKLTYPWYQFLLSVWQKCGGSKSTSSSQLWLQATAGQIIARNALTSAVVALVPSAPVVPGAIARQVLPASPWTFVAPAVGTLVVAGGQLEVARGASGWNLVGLTGGALPLLVADSARVTWFGAQAPQVAWIPSS